MKVSVRSRGYGGCFLTHILHSIYVPNLVIEVPLNNKETMLQRQISIERDETETGLEALEEPLKAKKRRESRPGRGNANSKRETQNCC
jgi:hypothetical protein